jgi:shikimate kinase
MPKVLLFGPPGSGKSTVGKALSKILGTTFSDTDALVEVQAGKKISAIFVEDGESAFRELEAEMVAKALRNETGVLALGGGAVMDPKTQSLIEASSALKIFLEVGIAQAAPRIGFNQDRPMLLVNPRQTWISLMQVRLPIYRRLADRTFSTDSKKAYEVAEEIAVALGEAREGVEQHD